MLFSGSVKGLGFCVCELLMFHSVFWLNLMAICLFLPNSFSRSCWMSGYFLSDPSNTDFITVSPINAGCCNMIFLLHTVYCIYALSNTMLLLNKRWNQMHLENFTNMTGVWVKPIKMLPQTTRSPHCALTYIRVFVGYKFAEIVIPSNAFPFQPVFV